MTSAEVCAAAGITYRQLDWWVACGYVRCGDSVDRPGHGYPRQWAPSQAARVVSMASLVRDGYEPARAAELAGDRQTSGLGWPA